MHQSTVSPFFGARTYGPMGLSTSRSTVVLRAPHDTTVVLTARLRLHEFTDPTGWDPRTLGRRSRRVATMAAMPDDHDALAPNNAAARVLAFLRMFQHAPGDQNESAMATLMRMFDLPQESSLIYLPVLQLRMQAESVPELMTPFATTVYGYRRFEQHYPQVVDATKRLSLPHQTARSTVFAGLDDAGWGSLEFANEVLSDHRAEATLTKAQEDDYLTRIRQVIDEVAADDSLAPHERERIVELLRKVEQALLQVKINGFLPVQEAAAAAGTLVRAPGFWDWVTDKPWARDFFTTIGGLVVLVQGADSGIAITEYVQKVLGG